MIDQNVTLPCGVHLMVAQAEPESYLLVTLNAPLEVWEKSFRIDPEHGRMVFGVDPDNLPMLRSILEEATRPKRGKLGRILDILREP